MTADNPSTEQTRLRCISTILDLDDDALQIVDTLLMRVADTDKPTGRKQRTRQAKRAAAPTTASPEVAR